MFRKLLIALGAFVSLLFVAATPAAALDCTGGTPANTCYWIGGTGTWDATSTTHWSFTSGGATCSCVPSSTTDKIVFDGSSGGGTSFNPNSSLLSGNQYGLLNGSLYGSSAKFQNYYGIQDFNSN